MVAPAVSVETGVATITISIATSIAVSLLPFPASPMSRLLLLLTLVSVITPLRQTSLSRVFLVVAYWLADASRNRVVCQDFTSLHSIAWVHVRALLLRSCGCWDTHSGVNSTCSIDCRGPFVVTIVVVNLLHCFCFAKTFVSLCFVCFTSFRDAMHRSLSTHKRCLASTLTSAHIIIPAVSIVKTISFTCEPCGMAASMK